MHCRLAWREGSRLVEVLLALAFSLAVNIVRSYYPKAKAGIVYWYVTVLRSARKIVGWLVMLHMHCI